MFAGLEKSIKDLQRQTTSLDRHLAFNTQSTMMAISGWILSKNLPNTWCVCRSGKIHQRPSAPDNVTGETAPPVGPWDWPQQQKHQDRLWWDENAVSCLLSASLVGLFSLFFFKLGSYECVQVSWKCDGKYVLVLGCLHLAGSCGVIVVCLWTT